MQRKLLSQYTSQTIIIYCLVTLTRQADNIQSKHCVQQLVRLGGIHKRFWLVVTWICSQFYYNCLRVHKGKSMKSTWWLRWSLRCKGLLEKWDYWLWSSYQWGTCLAMWHVTLPCWKIPATTRNSITRYPILMIVPSTCAQTHKAIKKSQLP